MAPGFAARPSGLRFALLLELRTYGIHDPSLSLLTKIASRSVPPQFLKFLSSGCATCLSKSNGGIRPIVVLEVITRLMSKLAIAANLPMLKEALAFQHGIKSPSAIHHIPNAIRSFLSAVPETIVVQLDITNAFGSVTRSALFEALRSFLDAMSLLNYFDLVYKRIS